MQQWHAQFGDGARAVPGWPSAIGSAAPRPLMLSLGASSNGTLASLGDDSGTFAVAALELLFVLGLSDRSPIDPVEINRR